MTMENVNLDENIEGYIYVFKKNDEMIKGKNNYQYKCFHELIPDDVIKICYKDFSEFYEVKTQKKSL